MLNLSANLKSGRNWIKTYLVFPFRSSVLFSLYSISII